MPPKPVNLLTSGSAATAASPSFHRGPSSVSSSSTLSLPIPSPTLPPSGDATPRKPRGLPTRLPRGGGAGKWHEIVDALDGIIEICSSSSEDGSEEEEEEGQLVWEEADADIDVWHPPPRQPRARRAERREFSNMLDDVIEIYSLSEDGSEGEEEEGQLVWEEADADIDVWHPPPRQPSARRAERREEATHEPEETRGRQQVFLTTMRRQREMVRRIEGTETVQKVVERWEQTAMDVQECREKWRVATEPESTFAHTRVDSFAPPDTWLPTIIVRPPRFSAVRPSANLARNNPRACRRRHDRREYRVDSVTVSGSHQSHYHRTSEPHPSSPRRATTDAEDEVPLAAPVTRKGVKTLEAMTGWLKWRKRVKKASGQ